jgi:hypothetical protein
VQANRRIRQGARVLLVVGAIFVVIQAVPYGRAHDNPPVTGTPNWNSERTRELFYRSCADCHSNETRWPWYSSIAPVSWLIQSDVNEGRSHFNVSEWGRPENDGDEAAHEVREGEMPLWFYLPLHPEARLEAGEKQELISGLVATFGDEGDEHDGGDEGNEHDH